MEQTQSSIGSQWSFFRKLLFRISAIYYLFFFEPWSYLQQIPGTNYVLQYWNDLLDWVVQSLNKYLFHVKEVLVYPNGSGDTSYGWAQQFSILLVAITGGFIWAVLDRKSTSFTKWEYWLRILVRYSLAMIAISYGVLKIFPLQMPYPLLGQMATPLGDFLPMRFSWLFIGYSHPYESFSGVLEALTALFLFNRKTINIGIFMACGVFLNVMMLNLSYDIPVKIYSINLFLASIFLLLHDAKRLFAFFVWNKPVGTNQSWDWVPNKNWKKIGRWILKAVFFVMIIAIPFYEAYDAYQQEKNMTSFKPLPTGIYDVTSFVRNQDTIPALITDTIRWQNLIMEKGHLGSVGSKDKNFRQLYGRGYFNIQEDSLTKHLEFRKSKSDSLPFANFKYLIKDSSIVLWGKFQTDSLHLVLKKSKRHFQLSENQFHWLSEANR
jgi:multidrug transporter EmrE-like cation transporter